MAGQRDRLLRIAQGAAGYRTRGTLGCLLLAASVVAIVVDSLYLRTAPSPSMVQAKAELERALAALDSYRLPRIEWAASELDELARLTGKAADALQRTRDVASQRAILNPLRDKLRSLAQDLKERESVRIVDWHARVAEAEGDLRRLGDALERSRDGIEAAIRQETRGFDRLRADIVGIFAWLTPYGAAFVLFTFVVLFLYPPAELLKPLSTLTSRLRGLSVAGLRVEFSGDQVRSDKAEIQYSFAIIENLMRSHYTVGATDLDLAGAFATLVRNVATALAQGKPALQAEQFRAALHVPFYFGHESLFQILDYFDVNGRIIRSMPGSGRVFSIRKGIMGRAWREEIARYDPRVSMDPNELVRKWGMTDGEARSAAGERRRQTFLAVRILDEAKEPLAIVYMDAKSAHVFDEDQSNKTTADDIDHDVNKARADELQAAIQAQAEACGIVSKLKTLRQTVGWNEERRLLFTAAL